MCASTGAPSKLHRVSNRDCAQSPTGSSSLSANYDIVTVTIMLLTVFAVINVIAVDEIFRSEALRCVLDMARWTDLPIDRTLLCACAGGF